ncbi:MAG: glycosyltransferase [Armatimonadota bacterium]
MQERAGPRHIILILNDAARDYAHGGNVREYALEQWAKRRGAEVWLVRDFMHGPGRLARLWALPRLLALLWKRPRATVILGYPGFPFFWSLDSAMQLARAFAFVAGMKLVGLVRRLVVVVDIMDLPRYQHVDLKYRVGLPLWLLKLFDRSVYHLATRLWVCSRGIAECIGKEMLWGRQRVVTVENGAFPSRFDGTPTAMDGPPRTFIYAGQLYETRGVPELVREFCRSKRGDVELRLCGVGGEWITERVSDPRVKHLGPLNEEDCAEAVAHSDVGVVYQPQGVYYDMVYPTKLPLYLARGRPVIATDNPELARAVKEKGVGIVVEREGIAAAIDAMTAESISTYAANAARARTDVYWDNIYDRAYLSLLGAGGCRDAGD